MDCRTARLLLEFDRPRTRELEADDADALESHLAHCSDCEDQARGERRIDQHLGQAMRQVEVPANLRLQLLTRLEANRSEWYRRWFGHGLRAVVAAAAVLLVVWGIWHWRASNPPELNVADVFNEQNLGRPTPQDVEEAFKRMGVTTQVPDDLNFAYLATYGLAELPGHPGKQVPQLLFLRLDQHARAVVYVVTEKQFNLKALAEDPQMPSGYPLKLEIRYQPGARYAYLIFHTGENIDWLKATDQLAT